MPAPKLHLAHDGSLHGQWLTRHALRLAVASGHGTLRLVHVGGAQGAHLTEQLRPLDDECRALGLTLEVERVYGTDTLECLDRAVPTGDAHLLVCGARATDRGYGLLAGTVSEQLLRRGTRHVLAIRVLDPGTLAAPPRLLLPLSGHPHAVRRALTVLRLMRGLREVSLLHVVTVGLLAYRGLRPERARALHEEAKPWLARDEALLREGLAPDPPRLSTRCVVSDDWPREALLAASRERVRQIFLGATDRALTGRFLLGNPLEQVLRDAPCDVAIFRQSRLGA